MSWFENFRQQNQHLFGEDSDFSDTEEDFEPEENEEIETPTSFKPRKRDSKLMSKT